MPSRTGVRRILAISLLAIGLAAAAASAEITPAPAEEVIEAWRSPWFYGPDSTSVNPVDGSCWVATDYEVIHLRADGLIAGHTGGFWGPASVSVNPTDSSCWVADTYNDQVVHLDADGTELWRGGGFDYPWCVSVYPTDNSCWVGQGHYDWDNGLWLTSAVLHLSGDGTELWRGEDFDGPVWVSVNPSDGSCWIAVYGNWDGDLGQQIDSAVVHLSADGTELWRGGGFNGAVSVSVNPTDGSCWVADSGNNEVVCLDADGNERWRGGAFESPWSVSVNPTDGSCWVTDLNHDEVVHLRADGVEMWRGGGFDQPFSLCVNPTDGSCWVPDMNHNQVIHLNADGGRLSDSHGYGQPRSVSVNPTDGSCWAATNTVRNEVVHLSEDGAELWRGGDFYWPLSVSVNPTDGSCWVADEQNGRVVHLDDDGNWLWSGSAGRRLPATVSVNPADGSCWVAGPGDDEVVHLDQDGNVLWTSSGGMFGYPWSVSVDHADGSCWVADPEVLHCRVLHLNAEGDWIGVKSDLHYPHAVSANPADGSCWVATGFEVQHLDTSGRELLTVGGFNWSDLFLRKHNSVLSVNPTDGSCWVADTDHDEVVHLAEDGTELWRGGGFSLPLSVSVNPTDGSCWVADYANWQLVHLVIVPQGTHDVSVTASCDPNTVGSAGTTSCTASFSDSQGHGIASWSWSDGGAGGSFAPSAALQNPTYTAAANMTGADILVHLTVSATCDGPDPLSDSGSTTLTVQPAGMFSDVPTDHWACAEIEACVNAGIVQGYGDGTYQPAVYVSRDQMAVYISRALAGGESNVPEFTGTPSFSDVPFTWWALKHIEYAVANNVVQGYQDNTYHPEETVDRAQMAVYVARAMVAPQGDAAFDTYIPVAPRNFPDVPSDSWGYKQIEYCVEQDVVQGYDDNLYHPEREVTRAQMAVYVCRAFGLLP